MADNENKAVIVFADGESIYVQSTVKQIHDEIGGATTPHIPIIKVVDEHGVDLWVNANHIRVFHEFVAGRPIGGVATAAGQRDAEKAAKQPEVVDEQETKGGVFDSMREVLSRFQEGAQGRDPDS
jgi:hypothetical protein